MEGIKKKTHTQNFLVISTQNKKIESQKTQRINTPTKTQKKMENTYDWLNSFDSWKERLHELVEEDGWNMTFQEDLEDYWNDILISMEILMEEFDLSEEGAFSQTIDNLIRYGGLKVSNKETKTLKPIGWLENLNEAIGEGVMTRKREKALIKDKIMRLKKLKIKDLKQICREEKIRQSLKQKGSTYVCKAILINNILEKRENRELENYIKDFIVEIVNKGHGPWSYY